MDEARFASPRWTPPKRLRPYASRVQVLHAPTARGTIVQAPITRAAAAIDIDTFGLPSKRAAGATRSVAAPRSPSRRDPSVLIWSSTGAATICQPRTIPIVVPRDPIVEETPSASTRASEATRPSQAAEPMRRLALGAPRYPANTIDPVAVIAKPAPTIGKRSIRPAGRRAANRASRERPVTTSSRKTPEPRSPAPRAAPTRIAATTLRVDSMSIEPDRFSNPPAGPCFAGFAAWRLSRTV